MVKFSKTAGLRWVDVGEGVQGCDMGSHELTGGLLSYLIGLVAYPLDPIAKKIPLIFQGFRGYLIIFFGRW